MKVLIMILKPLSFLPALAMMYLIYSFSAQTGEVSGELSYQISYELVETKDQILNTHKDEYTLSQEAGSIHYYVRKAAHMGEYFLLAIAVSFPLYVYGVRGIWLILVAGFICVGFAGLDEAEWWIGMAQKNAEMQTILQQIQIKAVTEVNLPLLK